MSGATRRPRRRPTRAAVLAGIVIVLLLWLVLYPNLFVVLDSLRTAGGLRRDTQYRWRTRQDRRDGRRHRA